MWAAVQVLASHILSTDVTRRTPGFPRTTPGFSSTATATDNYRTRTLTARQPTNGASSLQAVFSQCLVLILTFVIGLMWTYQYVAVS